MIKNVFNVLTGLFILSVFMACKTSEAEGKAVLVEKIDIEGEDILTGTSSQMTAIVLPGNPSEKTLLWETSDQLIATVNQSGLVTAISNGEVFITAEAIGKEKVKGGKKISVSTFDESVQDVTGNTIKVDTEEALLQAIAIAKGGDIIVVKGGDYLLNEKIEITSSGTENDKITLRADPDGGRPKLNFSSMKENSSNQGIELKADFWHIKGLDILNAGDNGMLIKGNNNLIEFCTFSECSDSGLQLDNGASNNTILNCDSYFNADSKIENADGFACKLRVGTGNKFIGCRAWNNLDDGWDGYLRENNNITTVYENCWAIQNGFSKDGTKGEGDGNGFKTGGSDTKDLKHNAVYKNCVAVGNVADGFDHNSNRGTVTLYNCVAYENGNNLNFSNTNPLEKLIIKNFSVLGSVGSINATNKDISHNSWMEGVTASEADYQSLETQQLTAPRKADGSLPDITFMHLQPSSDLIDKGVEVGLPFVGSAPDLGAFEYEN